MDTNSIELTKAELTKDQWAMLAKAYGGKTSLTDVKEMIKYNYISFDQFCDLFKPASKQSSKTQLLNHTLKKTPNTFKSKVLFPTMGASELYILLDESFFTRLKAKLQGR